MRTHLCRCLYFYISGNQLPPTAIALAVLVRGCGEVRGWCEGAGKERGCE